MASANDDPADNDSRDQATAPRPAANDARVGWKLYIPGQVDGGARLLLTPGVGRLITVKIKGRHVRPLLVLERAAEADAQVGDMDPADRGFRTVEEIAADYYLPAETAPAPSAAAITHYLSQVNGLVRSATPPGVEEVHLFETVRRVGVRLRQELTVVRRRYSDQPTQRNA